MGNWGVDINKLGVMQRKNGMIKNIFKINQIINEMPTHISIHLQFDQANLQAPNCKRFEILQYKNTIE